METTKETRDRIIVPGPAGFHPPSAAQLGVSLPEPGQGLMYGILEPHEEKVMEEVARQMLTRPNATIFPGPLILWAWNEHAVEKAIANGAIAGTESFPAKCTLEVADLKIKVTFDGEIRLQ